MKYFSIKALKTAGFISIPLLIAAFAIINFDNYSESITNDLSSETDGIVAGASESSVQDLTNEIPIFPNSEIASFSTTNESAFVTLETNRPEPEIRTYYDDYLLLNNWEQKDGKYAKDNKELTINISEGIIKITLKR